jgi:hypothetical protein
MVDRHRWRSANGKEYISAKLAQCTAGFNKIIKHLLGDRSGASEWQMNDKNMLTAFNMRPY